MYNVLYLNVVYRLPNKIINNTLLRLRRAHRAVLAARSPVFAAMFEHEMQESLEGKVHIDDVDGDVMQVICTFN